MAMNCFSLTVVNNHACNCHRLAGYAEAGDIALEAESLTMRLLEQESVQLASLGLCSYTAAVLLLVVRE